MKIVAVTQRIDAYPDRNELRDALDQKLSQFLFAGGYIPVPVPNGLYLDGLEKWVEQVHFQAILLSGGNNIGTYKERDLTEYWLLDYAEKHRLPTLGICRGMQMMGVRAGVKLKKVSGHVRTNHSLIGEISEEVNSFHEQSLIECPSTYKVLASSQDGEIEAIRHKDLPWEGWMWHPERTFPFDLYDIQRLKILFKN